MQSAKGPWIWRPSPLPSVFSSQGSEPAVDEGVPQQVLSRWPSLFLHKDLLEEVAAGAGNAVRELGVGRLGGDLKNSCHGFELCPRRLLC